MATTYKILGQSQVTSAGANVDLYVVPAATSSVISTLSVNNITGVPVLARIYIRKAGVAAALTNAIVYDAPIAANQTVPFTIGLTLAATDAITVSCNVASALNFMAFGSEIV